MLLYKVQNFNTPNLFNCTFIYNQEKKTRRCKNLSDIRISCFEMKTQSLPNAAFGIFYACYLLSRRKKSPYSELFWSAFFPHFPAFGLNTERYGVSLRIQSECWEIWTRITPNTDTFYAVRCKASYK